MTKNSHYVILLYDILNLQYHVDADVVELADTQDLGSCALWRAGSSPVIRTKITGGFFVRVETLNLDSRSPLRFGRCITIVHRTMCTLLSALDKSVNCTVCFCVAINLESGFKLSSPVGA